MRRKLLIAALLAVWMSAPAALADVMMTDDPLLTKLSVGQLEYRSAKGDNPVAWDDVNLWIGRDINKLWFKSKGEVEDGSTRQAELQMLYSRAIAPYWDVQVGWRGDFRPSPGRHWLALGLHGLAPYHFDVDATLFVGESGRSALRLETSYDLRITQRLILTPKVELDSHGHNDRATATGSGLSKTELGLRLRYEIRRELAPYIGIHYERRSGNTADFARQAGKPVTDTQLLLGIRFWL